MTSTSLLRRIGRALGGRLLARRAISRRVARECDWERFEAQFWTHVAYRASRQPRRGGGAV